MKTLEELGISPAPWEMKEAVPGILYVSDNDKDLVCNATFAEAPDEDTRLIAAAPELYEACAALLSCAIKEAPFSRESGMSIAMDMAKKAIAKAGGGE